MPNRLARETSPYLRQHADNPVDWYPWGEEAFRTARREAKPVFLSIGYSTCHWCHVMEEESFEDPETARLLNEHFVSIKVDREERPDVDAIYMAFVQATTGSGGWPLNVFLTPERKPFFGGTYFPRESRYGRPSFRQVLESVSRQWDETPNDIRARSNDFTERLAERLALSGGRTFDPVWLDSGFRAFRDSFDERYGGFGGSPKFPRPVTFNFLLRYHRRTGDSEALRMAVETLRRMAAGGMYDHVGWGFHRYATDREWRVPHFEKMLYDNAQLAVSYLEAHQLTGEEGFAETTRQVLAYLERDLSHPEGGFYSAEDADSRLPEDPTKKGEGAFYVWKAKEVDRILGEDAPLFKLVYGVERSGNTLFDPHGEFRGKNILYLAVPPDEAAQRSGIGGEEARRRLEEARRKLFEARKARPRPHLDDKVLTSWNGLAISAFARAGAALGEERYVERARKAAVFLRERLYDGKAKVLYRRWRDGERAVEGLLDDYAFLIQGLLDLYEADFDARWLEWAGELADAMVRRFEDRKDGGFYTSAGGEDLILRLKETYDGAEPSGNSVAVLDLLRLSQLWDRKDYREAAERALKAASGGLSSGPAASPQMLVALDFALSKPLQVFFNGDFEAPGAEAFRREIHRRFLPVKVSAWVDPERDGSFWEKRLPFTASLKPLEGRPTAYLCRNYACDLPTNKVEVFRHQLDEAMETAGFSNSLSFPLRWEDRRCATSARGGRAEGECAGASEKDSFNAAGRGISSRPRSIVGSSTPPGWPGSSTPPSRSPGRSLRS